MAPRRRTGLSGMVTSPSSPCSPSSGACGIMHHPTVRCEAEGTHEPPMAASSSIMPMDSCSSS